MEINSFLAIRKLNAFKIEIKKEKSENVFLLSYILGFISYFFVGLTLLVCTIFFSIYELTIGILLFNR